MELQGFQSSLKEFEAADTQVLGISVDTAPSAGAFAKTAGVTFPLLSDWPRYEVSRLYGTFREDRNVSQRVTFVIDKQGTVRGRTEEPRNMELHSQEALRIVKELAGKG